VSAGYSRRDRYQRIPGKVLLDDEILNLEQLKAGLAWHCNKHKKKQTPADRDLYLNTERPDADCSMALNHLQRVNIYNEKKEKKP
jgi:hypothetical protein